MNDLERVRNIPWRVVSYKCDLEQDVIKKEPSLIKLTREALARSLKTRIAEGILLERAYPDYYSIPELEEMWGKDLVEEHIGEYKNLELRKEVWYRIGKTRLYKFGMIGNPIYTMKMSTLVAIIPEELATEEICTLYNKAYRIPMPQRLEHLYGPLTRKENE